MPFVLNKKEILIPFFHIFIKEVKIIKSNNIFKLELINTIFIIIGGILLHFTYELTNNNFIALFSTVNESVWEHLKLIFFPGLITLIFSTIYLKDKNYLVIKTKGIIYASLFIIIFFYTYTGIIGKNIAILDISSFFYSVIILEYYTLKNIKKQNKFYIPSILLLIIVMLSFFLFTFYPPNINLFKDPLTNKFGIVHK